MNLQSEVQKTSIVVLGSFTPDIFHPTWFSSQNLIRPEEAKDTRGTVIVTPEIVNFDLAEWLGIKVLRHRLEVGTGQPPYFEALRDVAFGIFRLLPHTPITALGINHEHHYYLPSEDAWHKLGHRLAPKEDWRELFERPGLLRLDMQGERYDDYKGYIKIRVQAIDSDKYRILIEVNDHYQITEEHPEAAKFVQNILSKEWQSSADFAQKAIQTILSLIE
jgi:hypothetical protein